MRRRLTGFVQVAFGLLSPGLVLLAQQRVTGGPVPPSHPGGQVHVGPAPTLPGPSHTVALPSGPVTVRPGVRYPVAPISEQRHWPSAGTGPSHRPGGEQGGARHNDRYPGVYAGYPWLNSFGYGFPVAYGGPYIDDQEEMGGPQPAPQPADYGNVPPADYVQEPPSPQVANNAAPAFRPPYPVQIDTPPVHVQPATTLIFKDGRPSMQVHNYALTASTLYALDGDSHQEIPLSLLNVPATIEANRTAGVDFALPISR